MSRHSKVPSGYARPRVAVVHSASSWSRDLATYIGAHLVLGGYAEVDVAPLCRDEEEESVESLSIKGLKAYLAARDVEVPKGGIERSELVSLARAAPRAPRKKAGLRVVPHRASAKRGASAELVSELECRTNAEATAALAQAAMIIVCVDVDDLKPCAKAILEAARTKRDALPVVLLSADVVTYATFDAYFQADARPKSGEDDEERDLSGKLVVVDGAACFGVARREPDGALVALSAAGMLVLERLDAEREKVLSKFYDLLSTADIPIEYRARQNLTTATWGALLVNGPLLAAAALDPTTDYRTALCASRAHRRLAAAAMREARAALVTSAEKVKRRRDATPDDEDTSRRRKRTQLWRPTVDVAQALPSPLLFEFVLCLPNVLFAAVGARFALGAPFAAAAPSNRRASSLVAELRTACERVNQPKPCLDDLYQGLLDRRVKGHLPADFAATHRGPTYRLADAATFLALAFLVLALLAAALLLLDLLFPDRHRAAAFLRAEDEL